MRGALRPPRAGARRRAVAVASLVLASSVLAAGCIIEDRPSVGHYQPVVRVPPCPVASTTADVVTIDANPSDGISSPPGEGVGVLVDYDVGGNWHIWTVCDTALSGFVCAFDVTAQVLGGVVTDLGGASLGIDDGTGTVCDDTAFLSADTRFDTDDLRFTTTPGLPVQVTAALDGTALPNIIYWSEGDAVRNDASNPVTLTPATP
jgi:hypothetical protein